MSAKVTFRHLLVFRTVCEQRNVTRSAGILNTSQPALSRTIKELEQAVGRTLLIRSTRSIEPTTAGAEFYARAVRMLTELDAAVTATRDVADGRSGSLVISYMDFAIVGKLPDILRQFRHSNPTIHLDLRGMSTQEQIAPLKGGHVDVGFISGNVTHGGLNQRELYSERLFAVLPERHPLAQEQTIRLDQLSDEWFITGGHKWRYFTDLVEDLCAARGFIPKVSQVAPNRDGILGFVLAGAGISVYPECVCNAARPGLSFVPIKDTGRPVKVSMIWSAQNRNAALLQFLDHISGDLPNYNV